MATTADEELLQEIKKVYTHIERNEYKGGADGKIKTEVMPCACSYQPGDDPETACGDASDCINRALFLECSADDCPCGYNCMNRRFYNKQYGPIKVIKTELKGYGLKATKAMKKGQFVIEYCGEVLSQSMFLKRVRDYSESGAKHFYFMSIKSDEVIDAYKKGNHARFMNHSCVPNCELQKWVVGNQIRMGFFTVADVEAGEELTFDYKFERYGAEPQICYCGHSTCKGIIGGQQKTVINIEGGDDDGDEIDEEEENLTAKPRRAKSGSDDEDFDGGYRYDERGLQTVEAVKSFVKLMLYSTAKPTKLIRLLQKLELTQNPAIQRKFLQYHGLPVLKSTLAHHCKSNPSICYQTLRILKNLPPVSRNSIVDSGLETIVKKLADPECSPPSVTESAEELLEIWSQFTTVYRIPKRAPLPPSESAGTDQGNNGNNATNSSALKRSPDNQTPSSEPASNPFIFSAADLFNKRPKFDPQRTNSNPLSEFDSRTNFNPALPLRPTGLQRVNSGSSVDPQAFSRRDNSPRPFGFDSLNGGGGAGGGMGQVRVESVMDTLPKGWSSAKNEEGRLYYYCVATSESRWDFPRDIVSESSPAEGTSIGSGVSGSGGVAVVPEVRVKSSMIEGLDEAAIDLIVQRANAGSLRSPIDEESSLKALRGMISELVVKTLSRHKETLGSDTFKNVARKCTHNILQREIRHKTQGNHANGLSDETKVLMKKAAHKYLKSFMEAAKGGTKKK
ncbi:hypothetical protein BDR26DRAFT_874677 [Obelidium mucronatum]|nr:hypothetical protein BDR26DRAFT_874677 [Obelidium mucronatum]